jgi:Flp pilus assembly protein TadD/CRP-like cAMP-binding protein
MSGSSSANPFVGPRPIERGQPIFGRDAEIEGLYYLLSAERIVLFHSPSGAGKSSLLQAGLLPRLAQQFDVWIPVRVSLPPGNDAATNRYVRSVNLSFEAEVPEGLRRAENAIAGMSLAEYFMDRPRRRSAPGNTVLIFDQFEEILTVDPMAFEARREFFSQLGTLLQNPRIWAVFALREDYLAQLDPFADQLPTHLKNRFRLDLLRREAAEEAIRRSAEGAGRSFAPEALRQLTADLAKMQVQLPSGEFRAQTGPYIEPLHLQVTCRELWERMPASQGTIGMDAVTSFGDVTAALAAYYASSVGKVAAGDDRVERKIRRWFGEELIARGVRVQRLREPKDSGGLDNALVEKLIDAHLVRGEVRASATWYELAHDRLIEPVLRDNQEWFAAHLSTLEQRALQWQREGEPEGLLLTGAQLKAAERWAAIPGRALPPAESRFLALSRRKRVRLLQKRAAVAALVVLLAVMSLLALIAYSERNRAEQNLSLAEQAVNESLASAGQQQAQEFPDSPDLDAFRNELLKKAASFYTSFTQQEANNAQLRADEAWGHAHLADADRLLGQSAQAVAQYQAAIAAFQSLAQQHPRDTEYAEALGYCHNWMGETYRAEIKDPRTPDPTLVREATQEYNAALGYQQKLHTGAPDNRQWTQELARSYYNRGIVESDQGDRSHAESDYRLSLALLLPIGSHPATGSPNRNSSDPAEDLARVQNNFAVLLVKEGNNNDARTHYDQAIQLAKELSAASPNNRGYSYELATYCLNEALLLQDMNDLAAAAELDHTALDLVETLANPAPSLSLTEVTILQLHTEILLAQGSSEALDEAERERELLTRLETGNPEGHPLFHRMYGELAANYSDLAERDLRNGDPQGAQIALRSLSLIMTELTPATKRDAEAHYVELERELRVKMMNRQ